MGDGLHINPTPPEDAARFLREVNLLQLELMQRNHNGNR